MQDRFKFRLFGKSISEMSYDVCVGYNKDGVKRNWVCADTTCGQITYTDKRLNDIVLMQCTGLKDKNGKLIYEGDVCNYQRKEDGDVEAVKIVWDAEYARIGMWHNGIIDDMPRNTEVKLEVIGNEYENPELLEDL